MQPVGALRLEVIAEKFFGGASIVRDLGLCSLCFTGLWIFRAAHVNQADPADILTQRLVIVVFESEGKVEARFPRVQLVIVRSE